MCGDIMERWTKERWALSNCFDGATALDDDWRAWRFGGCSSGNGRVKSSLLDPLNDMQLASGQLGLPVFRTALSSVVRTADS